MRRLYLNARAQGQALTMAKIAVKLGFRSSGYVSDVLNGRRVLKPEVRIAVVRLFSLKAEAARCLQLLILIDNEKDSHKRTKLRRRLSLARKALQADRKAAPVELQAMFFSLDVFCAFGLFRGMPTTDDLVDYFGPQMRTNVVEALESLRRLGLVTTEADRHRLLSQYWLLADQVSGFSHVDFIRYALRHAAENVERWFPQPNNSILSSTIISTTQRTFAREIPKMRRLLSDMQTKLETSDADAIVRFNVQIYPVGARDIK